MASYSALSAVASRASSGFSPATAVATPTPDDAPRAAEPYDPKKAFGAIARITVHKQEELTPRQRARLDAFTRRYTARTAGSKRFTQENRAHMADPRAVTGFRPQVKELVYPIVVERSAGARLWDVVHRRPAGAISPREATAAGDATAIVFSADGGLLYAGAERGIAVWEVPQGLQTPPPAGGADR